VPHDGPRTERRPVRRSDLRSGAYSALLEMLTENRFPPDSSLKIGVLAELLEVSPTPVREALVQLEATGLVVYLPNLGFRVAPEPGPDEVTDMMDARSVLEIAAARRAAGRQDPAVAAALDERLDAQRAAARGLGAGRAEERATALREYLRCDHSFHFALFDGSGNPALARLAAVMDTQAMRVRQTFSRGISDADDTLAEHAAIAEAVARGDADAAERAMRAHLMRVLEDSLGRTRSG
jgi:DNA-binding GntR family transcriptional regulator